MGEDLRLELIIAKCHLYEQKQESKEIIDHTDNQARSTSDVHAVRGRNFKPLSFTKFQQSKPQNKPQNSKQHSDGRTTQSNRRSCLAVEVFICPDSVLLMARSVDGVTRATILLKFVEQRCQQRQQEFMVVATKKTSMKKNQKKKEILFGVIQ